MSEANSVLRELALNVVRLDDVTCCAPETRFPSLLDVEVWTRVVDALCTLFAQIQASSAIPGPICYVFCFILCAQFYLSWLLLNCTDIWPPDSLLTKIFVGAGSIFQGPSNRRDGVIFSFIIFFILSALLVFFVIRAHIFRKSFRMSRYEMWAVLVASRLLIPVLLPMLLAGIPPAWLMIIDGDHGISTFVGIFNPLLTVLTLALLFSIFLPRVLLEHNPLLSWSASFSFTFIIGSALSAFLSSICAGDRSAAFVIIPIVNCAFCVRIIVSIFRSCLMVQAVHNVFWESFLSVGAVVSLVQLIAVCADVPPMVALIVSPFVFVIAFLGFRTLHFRRSVALLVLCDEFDSETDQDAADARLQSLFPSAGAFVVKICAIVDLWPPALIRWRFFDFALRKWPADEGLLFLYGRLLACFRELDTEMLWVGSLLAKHSYSVRRSCYLIQFRSVYRSRRVTIVRAIQRRLDRLREEMGSVILEARRFWQSVLQKDVAGFWDGADRLGDMIDHLGDDMDHVTRAYPNCVEVHELCSQFQSQINRSSRLAGAEEATMSTLRRDGRIGPDLAMALAQSIFPNLAPVSGPVVEPDAPPEESDILKTTIHPELHQLDAELETTVYGSSLGRVAHAIALLCVATAATVACYIVFMVYVMDGFIARHEATIDFLDRLGLSYTEMYLVRMLLTVFPPLNNGVVSVSEKTMTDIAPNLYIKFHEPSVFLFELPPFLLPLFVDALIAAAHDAVDALDQLDHSAPEYTKLYAIWHTDDVAGGRPLLDIIHEMENLAAQLAMTTDFHNYFVSPSFEELERLVDVATNTFVTINETGHGYAVGDFDERFTRLTEYMVLIIAGTILLVALPFTLYLFRLYLQTEGMAVSFSYFPSSDIRALISQLGLSASKVDDVSRVALLPPARKSRGAEYARFWFAMLISFVPFMGICFGTHYSMESFGTTSNLTTAAITNVYQPWWELWASFCHLMRVFIIDSGFANSDVRPEAIQRATESLARATVNFSNSLWGRTATARFYFQYRENISTFASLFDTDPPLVMSLFESWATMELPLAIDSVLSYERSFLITVSSSAISAANPRFLSLWYYLVEWSVNSIVFPFCGMVRVGSLEETAHYQGRAQVLLVVGVVWQAIACALLVAALLASSHRIRRALRLYQYISPAVLLENKCAIRLITEGRAPNEAVRGNFADADHLLADMELGAALVDRELTVVGANPALGKLFEQEQVRGRRLGELLADSDSWLDVVQAVRDVLANVHPPQFCGLVQGNLPSGKTVHLSVNAIALLVTRVAAEGEGSDIHQIAVIVTDYTDIIRAQMEIEEDQQKLTAMLRRVIPVQLCDDLQNGAEVLSTDAQSATVGCVKVVSPGADEFRFLPRVFTEFDGLLEGFDLLIRARTVFNTYVFAGGLFAKGTRAGRHAEEAVRFSLKLLVTANSIARHLGRKFELFIGLHTGGPIVTGIMSQARPTFQIIAPVMDCAAQMAETAITGEVHITRSTFEHIFASGFKTRERGEVAMKGGGTMVTYLVSPG